MWILWAPLHFANLRKKRKGVCEQKTCQVEKGSGKQGPAVGSAQADEHQACLDTCSGEVEPLSVRVPDVSPVITPHCCRRRLLRDWVRIQSKLGGGLPTTQTTWLPAPCCHQQTPRSQGARPPLFRALIHRGTGPSQLGL